jgi:hypothetical protein
MDDGVDIRPEDALQIAQRALAKVNGLEERVDELEGDVTELSLRLSEHDEDRRYESLTIDEKIGMVREHGFVVARDGHGKAALDYKDIRYGCFDGEPGASTCYRLMRRAAGYDQDGTQIQDIPGFEFDQSTRPMRLTVNAEAAKRSAAFLDRKKSISAGGRSE